MYFYIDTNGCVGLSKAMDYPRFSTTRVAHAAGVKVSTLQQWLARGLIYDEDVQGGDTPGRGHHRLFSMRRATQVAIMARLTSLGLAASIASKAAAEFTDVGETTVGWTGDAPAPEGRNPGELFEHGNTILLMSFDRQCGVEANVINSIDAEELAQQWIGGDAHLTLNLAPIVWQVQRELEPRTDADA